MRILEDIRQKCNTKKLLDDMSTHQGDNKMRMEVGTMVSIRIIGGQVAQNTIIMTKAYCMMKNS